MPKNFVEESKKRMFLRDLSTVSQSLEQWAMERFRDEWSLDQIKQHLKSAMDIVEKQK